MLKVRVKQVEFSDGTSLLVPETGVVLFVGPNNAGKSQALRDVVGHARGRGYSGKVVTTIDFIKDGSKEDALTWTSANLTEVVKDGVTRIHVPGWGEVQPSDFAQLWSNTSPDRLTDTFFLHADGTTRLTAGNAQASIDFRTQFPTNPIQRAARDSRLEKEFCDISESAFGLSLTVDRFAGSVIPLRMGPRPTFDHTDGVPSSDYLEALGSLPTLEEQGDGARSFLGLMTQLIAGRHQVLLIDEPEAFLHPPQARLLGRLLAERAAGQQVFIATHSSDIVQGALEGGNTVTIVRLKREGTVNHAAVLDHAALQQLWSDPLLRYSDVLTGLFHDAVVLCESDSDCRFYSAVRDRLFPEGVNGRRRELLFTHCGGKGRLSVVVQALVAVEVPVLVVADFDILRDANDVRRVFESLGGNWDELSSYHVVLAAALASDVKPLRKTPTRDALNQALDVAGEILTPKEVDGLRAILKAETGWDKAKRAGLSIIPQGTAAGAAQSLVAKGKTVGLFIVPVGELERFVPTVGGHGPAWVNEVLTRRLHESPSPDAASFITDIESFARQV